MNLIKLPILEVAYKMKRAVQQQLLDFLGGGKYNIRIADGMFNKKISFRK